MYNIKDYKKLINDYNKSINNYVNKIPHISQVYNDISDDIKNIIIDINNSISSLSIISNRNSFMNFLDTSNFIKLNINKSNKLIYENTILENNISGISSDYIYNLNKLIESINYYKTTYITYHNMYIDYIYKRYINYYKDLTIDDINDLLSKYKNLYEFYIYFISNIIDSKHNDKIFIDISNKKYSLLNKLNVNNKHLTHNKGVMLQKFGLRPIINNISEEKIMERVLKKELVYDKNNIHTYGGSVSNYSKLDELFKLSKIGIFLIINITPDALEYKYSKITNNYNNYKVNSGITSKQIVDLTTNIKLDKSNNIKKIDIRYIKLGDVTSNKWVVLKTLDGVGFTLMGFDSIHVMVNKYLIDKMYRGPSLSIDNYNKYHSDILYNNIDDVVVIPVNDNNYNNIKILNNISNKISLTINNYILDQLSNNKIKSLKDIFNIIDSNEFDNICIDVLIKSYDISEESTQLYASFLLYSNKAIESFIKSSKDGIIKSNINQSIFSTKERSYINSFLYKKIKDIIDSSANKSFSISNNLFDNLSLKKSILNILV